MEYKIAYSYGREGVGASTYPGARHGYVLDALSDGLRYRVVRARARDRAAGGDRGVITGTRLMGCVETNLRVQKVVYGVGTAKSTFEIRRDGDWIWLGVLVGRVELLFS